MDSLARTLHSSMPGEYNTDRSFPNPVVTAVGFTAQDEYPLAIAHNATSDRQKAVDAERLEVLRKTLKGEMTPHDAACRTAPSSGFKPKDRAQERLEKDYAKLRNTFRGVDDGKVGGKEFRAQLAQVFNGNPVQYVDHTIAVNRGAVHGESALLAESVPGLIGVSKLSCGDCSDYAVELKRSMDIRGTHGERFPGWQHPTSGQIEPRARFTSTANQFPDDSDSEVELESQARGTADDLARAKGSGQSRTDVGGSSGGTGEPSRPSKGMGRGQMRRKARRNGEAMPGSGVDS
ncbi:hypothetical protein OOZ63_17140 [Paucibacter sp. PLA-PC-4]|uniref:hypothetical protein n=1 Tax=Paucibacter sp. PLA-PC-4 TaxID=2993655 RepID=UPI00224AD4E8|nr:hypothetical protein [Paucibacter sp. PLA-PC-4]MCX2863559.1 hypothetical protein [Paucibacter sp. PLA-PC-4]